MYICPIFSIVTAKSVTGVDFTETMYTDLDIGNEKPLEVILIFKIFCFRWKKKDEERKEMMSILSDFILQVQNELPSTSYTPSLGFS